MVLIGEAVGLAGALMLNRLLATMVFGVSTTDRVTYVLVSASWAALALLACYLPASRARRIEPIKALRCE